MQAGVHAGVDVMLDLILLLKQLNNVLFDLSRICEKVDLGTSILNRLKSNNQSLFQFFFPDSLLILKKYFQVKLRF